MSTLLLILEVLKNVSFNWNNIISEVHVYTTNKTVYAIDGENMTWSLTQQYPSCQMLDMTEYFDFEEYTPLQIFIYLSKLDKIGVSVFFEETNKALSRRLKTNMLSYQGPTFQNNDLSNPIDLQGIVKISQNVDSEEEENKKCKNYPFNNSVNFKDCDEKYNVDQFSSIFQLMPFWVAKDLEEVSEAR